MGVYRGERSFRLKISRRIIQHWENRVQEGQMKQGMRDNLKRVQREKDGHKEYGRGGGREACNN